MCQTSEITRRASGRYTTVKYFYVLLATILWVVEALVMSKFHLTRPGLIAPSALTSGSVDLANRGVVYSIPHIIAAIAATAIIFAGVAALVNQKGHRLSSAISWAAISGVLSVLAFALARLDGLGGGLILAAGAMAAIIFAVNNGAQSTVSGRYGDSWINP